MSSRDPRSQVGGQRGRRRQSGSLLIPIIGGIIGFVAALFLLRELDLFEADPPPPEPSLSAACDYPVGSYFDQLCQLVARATREIQSAIDPDIAARCLDVELDCRLHRENLRRGLPDSERFRDALFELSPPEAAQDWHTRYLTAISLLHSGYNAQFVALQANDREALLDAHARTLDASILAGQLFDDFLVAFSDERES